MLSQVCACVPEEKEAQPPVVKKQKKPQPKKNRVEKERKKSTPAPVVEEKTAVVDEEPPEVTEPEVQEVVREEPVEAEPKVIETVEVDSEEDDAAGVASPAPASNSVAEVETVQEVSLEDAYIQEHINEIMALLKKNLYYPRLARKRGIEGKVLVRFELLTNGDIENITVLETEREILARAAVMTIERLEGEFPLPEEVLTLTVPIVYQLR
jgi:protein TonB